MLWGTHGGAILALITYFSFGRLKVEFAWDELLHFVVEGALAIGLASGIARLIAPPNRVWSFASAATAGAPVSWRSRIGRWLMPEARLAFALTGVVYAEVLAGRKPLGAFGLISWLLAWFLCAVYLLGLVLVVSGGARRLLRTASDEVNIAIRTARVEIFAYLGSIASPIVGYLLGTAVTLFPGADGWSLAPLYGIMLAVAGHIVLAAVAELPAAFGVEGGGEAERPDEKAADPVQIRE
jgi:hypothetical protein